MKKSFKTNDYDMFGFYEFNREVINETKIYAIMQEMKERGFDEWNPIIVSCSNKVADGQHKLEAAKRLGIDVFVDQFDREFTADEIRAMNKNRTNWTRADFIHSQIDCEGAQLLYTFIVECRNVGISQSSACTIAMAANHKDQNMSRNNEINEQELESARTLLAELVTLQIYVPCATKSNFVGAYMRAKACPNFDINVFIKKLKMVKFTCWSLMSDLIEEIEETYNYKNKDKISINRDGLKKR